MSISINRYVNITSGVAVGLIVPRRNLVTRLFSTNTLIPPLSFIQFSTAAEVGQYFGTTSFEYQRALFYFGWISKNTTKPQFIQFARWVQTSVAPMIFGNPNQAQVPATYVALTTPNFSLTLGNDTQIISPNFSPSGVPVTTMAAVAAAIQTAIRAADGSNNQFALATVTFNAANSTLNLVGGSPISAAVSVAAGTATDMSMIMGWLPQQTVSTTGTLTPGAIWVPGALLETVTQTLTNSAGASNNFGSFAFMANLTLAQAISAAQWNEALNVEYMYLLPIFSTNLTQGGSGDANWAATDGSALGLIGGVAPTLHGGSGEFHEMVPGMILAATAYNQPNSVQNYMFQQFNLTPTVTTDAQANLYDSLRVNYYGSSQDAGQMINFYQRGIMFGLPADPADLNIYANEMWLKDAIAGRILTALLGLSRISANEKGRSQLTAIITPILNEALNNGTISPGKFLTEVQKLYITEATNDNTTWHQVQTLGYYFNVRIVFNEDATPVPGYEADYLLVYSKDDDIRKVNGTQTLI